MGKDKMMRAAVLCVAILLVSFGASELVEELQEEAVAEGVGSVKYHKIPGVVLRMGATVLKDKTNAQCRATCTAEPKCRSYSYDALDKKCLWSTESMTFDPNFVMMTKATDDKGEPRNPVKWRTMYGVIYRAKGWLKSEGKTKAECESMCAKSKTCRALSYRSQDQTCLVSSKGLGYSTRYTYYEKSGLSSKAMKMRKNGGATLDDKAKKKAAADCAKNKAEKAALIKAEQAKMNLANKEISTAKAEELKASERVAKEKVKTKAEIAKAKENAKDKLLKDENKFSKDAAAKMQQKTETMKLQLASAELKQKASHTENKADREKERTAKAAASVKAHAARKAARAVAAGAQEAAQRVEKAQLSEKLKNAQSRHRQRRLRPRLLRQRS